MYFIYVDESGDIGLSSGSSKYFVLSGLVFHELKWSDLLEEIISFRKSLKSRYGLNLREEIHSSTFLNKPNKHQVIAKSLRLRILRDVLDFQSQLKDINVINICIDKTDKSTDYDVFEHAWTALIQRFENTLLKNNFPGPRNRLDYGVIAVDRTDERRLRNLLRRMRYYNPVPSLINSEPLQLPVKMILEDCIHRHSHHSYFIQMADVNAYFLKQKLNPCGYVKLQGARNYFNKLDPVLCKVASRTNRQGIVML